MIRVGILGAQGRMGRAVQHVLTEDSQGKAKIHAAVDREDDITELLDCDCVIDFSTPVAATSLATSWCAVKHRLPILITGTTGWSPEQLGQIKRLSRKTFVMMASNFSTGVAAFSEILGISAPLLKALGYTVRIVETHHVHKKDAPSGTALTLSQSLKWKSEAPIESIRTGEVIGDHEVIFSGPGDEIRLLHHAKDRSLFARGAVSVALDLARRRPARTGLWSMEKYFKEKFL